MNSHYMGHGITSRPLKHNPKIPPRDFKELCTDHIPIIFKQSSNIYRAYTSHVNLYNQPLLYSRSNLHQLIILHP